MRDIVLIKKKMQYKVKQFCYNNNIKWYIIIGE